MNMLDNIDPDINYYDNSSMCSYFGTSSMRIKLAKDNTSLKILHLNIRSARKNLN